VPVLSKSTVSAAVDNEQQRSDTRQQCDHAGLYRSDDGCVDDSNDSDLWSLPCELLAHLRSHYRHRWFDSKHHGLVAVVYTSPEDMKGAGFVKRVRMGRCLQCESGSFPQSVECVSLGTLRGRWHFSIVRVRRQLLRVRILFRALLAELGSLYNRIKILWRHRLPDSGVDLGPVYAKSSDGHLLPCIRTRACTSGIAKLQELYPWLALTDLCLCQRAWAEGFESCVCHSAHSGNQSHANP
jgi:hypothetical protein